MSNYQKAVDTVRRKGIQAYFDGLDPTACPYTTMGKQGRKYKRLWLEGYVDARERQIRCELCGAPLTRTTGCVPVETGFICKQAHTGKPTPALVGEMAQ